MEHKARKDEPPNLILVCDSGLKFGEEVILDADPFHFPCEIENMDKLCRLRITIQMKQLVRNKWKVMDSNLKPTKTDDSFNSIGVSSSFDWSLLSMFSCMIK